MGNIWGSSFTSRANEVLYILVTKTNLCVYRHLPLVRMSKIFEHILYYGGDVFCIFAYICTQKNIHQFKKYVKHCIFRDQNIVFYKLKLFFNITYLFVSIFCFCLYIYDVASELFLVKLLFQPKLHWIKLLNTLLGKNIRQHF